MIDTIMLRIPADEFTIWGHELFSPNASGLFFAPYLPFADQPFIKCVQNPTKYDQSNKIYKPRLTLYKSITKGGFDLSLHIELSLPKLFFGNNFDELVQEDITLVIEILHQKLFAMGVSMKKSALWQAQVYTAHFCKNIAFTEGTTVSLLLDRIYKARAHGRFDINTIDYRNGGELLRYHTKAFSIVMYDKIAELAYSKARTIEKRDRTFNPHPTLFDAIRKEIPLEVFRLEIRVCDRRKLAKLANLPTRRLTLENIVTQSLAQEVLLNHWLQIFEALKVILLQEMDMLDQVEYLTTKQPQIRPQKLLAMLALGQIIKLYGYRSLQKRGKYQISIKALNRLYADLKLLTYTIENRTLPFKTITQQLQTYSPLKLKQFGL